MNLKNIGLWVKYLKEKGCLPHKLYLQICNLPLPPLKLQKKKNQFVP